MFPSKVKDGASRRADGGLVAADYAVLGDA